MNRSIKKWSLVLLSTAIVVWSAIGSEFNLVKFLDFGKTVDFFVNKWLPLDLSILPDAAGAAIQTLQIAIMGSILGLFIALPLSFLAAWNTAPYRWVYTATRGILNFLRSVPEIVLGLLFVPTFGLGPFAAVMAIALHNIGVLGKLIAELIEAADDGPQEAVQSVGGRRFLIILYGIIPQIIPNIFSHYFYRLEVAIRASLILGFIGGGGIGNMLFIDFKVFNFPAVATEVLMIMLLVMIVDAVGSIVRKRVI
jgi:phosphonate transport system permease protein